ncbi:MAG: NeuD/PglB/VioB family sugar acetyltransferase [Ferruginibacter sp.]
MLVAGAKGHAVEIIDVLLRQYTKEEVLLFDNVSESFDMDTISRFRILKTDAEVKQLFEEDNRFVLGTGNPSVRKKLADYLGRLGGQLCSVISPLAVISNWNVSLGSGINIMHGAIIQPEVTIGEGTLINAAALVHHESKIGQYCEICPGAIITGHVSVGDFTMIGSGAVILPGIKIGAYVKVGAGAVVTADVEDGVTIVGSPARRVIK